MLDLLIHPGIRSEAGDDRFQAACVGHHARVDQGIVAFLEELVSGQSGAALRVAHGIRKDVPRVELLRDVKIGSGGFVALPDDRGPQRTDRFRVPPGARTQFADFDEPVRIAVRQLVQSRVAGKSVVETHQAFFEPRLRFEDIGAIGPGFHRPFVIRDRPGEVFGDSFDAAKHDGPAIIERRFGRGLAIERHQSRRLAMGLRVRGGFLGERLVFGVAVEHFDILVHRAGSVFETVQRRHQAAAHGGDAFDALCRSERRLLQALDDGELKITEAAIVFDAEIGVRHGREIFGAHRIGREQTAEQCAGAIGLTGIRRDPRGLQRELGGEIGACAACRIEQQFDRWIGLVIADVKIDCPANHAEDQRMVAIQRVDHACRSRDILLRFQQAGSCERQPHLVDRVVGDGCQAFGGPFLGAVEAQTARVLLKRGQFRGGRGGLHAGLQQRSQILPALQRLQHRNAHGYRLRRGVRGDSGLRAAVHQIARGRTVEQSEQAVGRGVFPGERAGDVLAHRGGGIAFALVDRARLVGVERRIVESFARRRNPAQRVVIPVVVPVDRRGVQIGLRLSRLSAGHPLPVCAGARKEFAIGVDVAHVGEQVRRRAGWRAARIRRA